MTQHRLARVQVVNWGTFNGAWSFTVPWKGLLLTGPSGAGKSSILDAMAAVLVRPARLRFNAAAQGTDTGDKDRTLVTYVRGAHKRETDEATGEVGTAFLRKGPTWSAVALTYTDSAGRATTLLRLFHIRGGSTDANDLKSMYAIASQDVDVLALEPYVANGIEHRRMKADLRGWDTYAADRYSAFAERFRRLLGMGSEQAQTLLHKTQSAKNLTNLDSLFRDFMLDAPGTFELAETTIDQFGELRTAHAAVVDARRQVEALSPLRTLDGQLSGLATEAGALAAEEEHLEAWLTGLRLEAVRAELAVAEPLCSQLDREVADAGRDVEAAEAARQRAQRNVDRSGGAQLATLESLQKVMLGSRAEAEVRRVKSAGAAAVLGLELPDAAAGSADFLGRLAEVARVVDAAQRTHDSDQIEQLSARKGLRDSAAGIRGELGALRRHGSNLDARLLELRERLAALLQTDEQNFPFVGELIQVLPDEAGWTGAIERVLGSFARTLIVPERHYLAAAEFIDREFLGTRLVYERVADGAGPTPRPRPGRGALPGKIELAQGPFTGWVAERLHRRYDYACVEHAPDLRQHERAVTRNGQVKHSASLHEKDDRRRVDDRSRWVLGFSTEAKEAELERRLAELERRDQQIEEALRLLDAAGRRVRAQQSALRELDQFAWEQIDVAAWDDQLKGVADQMADLRSEREDLATMEAELVRAGTAKQAADERLRELTIRRDEQRRRADRFRGDVERLAEALTRTPEVPDTVADALAAQAEASGAGSDRLEAALRDSFRARADTIQRATTRAERQAERQMADYCRGWPSAAADWGESREYLPEYLTRLGELEEDRLPEFEDRFFDLLQRQARNNIGQIAMQIRSARREIRGRVDEVNKSLLLTPFGFRSYLQIKVLDRSLPDVDRFLRTLGEITEGSVLDAVMADSAEERALAEERFNLMQALLQRLGSADPADRAWRDRCLDTRQHVQFQARVVDEGGSQIDVFTGSGGRSGGERQKLVTFCLAAALRFQLAPEGQVEPTYALVVIDEAFDKADHTFTQAGLEVFRTFGFQLLLATPMKMLQTIDDYVGGVVMVQNQPGVGSVLQELHYDLGRPRNESEASEQAVLL